MHTDPQGRDLPGCIAGRAAMSGEYVKSYQKKGEIE